MFSNFSVLCQMSKYFGTCFGPSTRELSLSTQMPQLFIIKICFTIKFNSIYGVGRDTRNLCHKFNSQGPYLRILGLRVASPKSQGPSSRVLCLRAPVPGSWVSGSRVSESQSPGSQDLESQGPRVPGLKVPGPESQVLILSYALQGQECGKSKSSKQKKSKNNTDGSFL